MMKRFSDKIGQEVKEQARVIKRKMTVAEAQAIILEFRRVISSKIEIEVMKIEQQMELDEARRILEAKKEADHQKRLEEFKHFKTNLTEDCEIDQKELFKDNLKE